MTRRRLERGLDSIERALGRVQLCDKCVEGLCGQLHANFSRRYGAAAWGQMQLQTQEGAVDVGECVAR